MEAKQTVFASSLVHIEKVCCQRAQRGISCEECKSEHQITIPLSGLNVRHVGSRKFAISPAHITLSNRGEEYRVSHPYGSGEVQLNLVLQETLLLDLLSAIDPATENRRDKPFAQRQLPVSSQLHLAMQLLIANARSNVPSHLELEETAIALLDRMLKSAVQSNDSARSSKFTGSIAPRDVELAQRTNALLGARHHEAMGLQDIATELAVSVYHLCRVYRRATGGTIWSTLQQLRIRSAVVGLSSGEDDLARLSVDLGFAHHSHFTAAFRRELGMTPSAARGLLKRGSLTAVHSLLAH